MLNLVAMLAVFLASLGGAPLWAHGGLLHVMGTVTAIDASHIEVKTLKGDTISLQLIENTRYYSKNTQPASSPPRLGDRVLLHAGKEDAALKAVEVKYYRRAPRRGLRSNAMAWWCVDSDFKCGQGPSKQTMVNINADKMQFQPENEAVKC
jgi:hypothetical protein